MMMSKSPPGVMVYFDDVLPALDLLSNEEAGRLFRSMLEYAKFGIVPDLGDSVALNMAWKFIQPQIERDKIVYDKKLLQKRHAVYCREQKKKGIDPLDFEEWLQTLSTDDSENRAISSDIERYPTPITTPTTSSAPTTEPSASSNPSSYPALKVEGSPSEGSDTALFGLLDDGPGFDALRSEAIKLLEGYR